MNELGTKDYAEESYIYQLPSEYSRLATPELRASCRHDFAPAQSLLVLETVPNFEL